MSGQPNQRVRRNVSPASTKQRPIKAVVAFSLKNGNPSRNNSSASPTQGCHKIWPRKSPDSRLSPERKSPASPSLKEKTKSHKQSPVPSLWRASSLDTIYLAGQWPKDINPYHHYQNSGVFTCEKSTQTPEEWDTRQNDRKRDKGHTRSASFGQADQLKVLIKQRLQKTKEGSKQNESAKRQSPVQGKHSALSLTAPPAFSKAIVIPAASRIPVKSMSRYQRNSVEGLNTEIEKLVLKAVPGNEVESDLIRPQEIPDGHRAPVPEVRVVNSTMRSVDTQTPSAQLDEPRATSSNSRSDSISPAIPIMPGTMDSSRPSSRSESADSKSDKELVDSPEPSIAKFVSSPKPNTSRDFVREPPDGCEKVKVIEENRHPVIKDSLFCPVKPSQLVFKPSQNSAFYPLYKTYFPDVVVRSPIPTSSQQTTTIEGQ
ncbi:glucocorticoid-induced transcript 1 protein-like [Gigantopelta aegis]|uniref:glucocorticoid-induced transcript 1 protein-like n=1 Tax=Gigantopelta aegis TaxID=1735272 RepID=UPI001B888080|nr:glucocorticoid-induced transcript 1 protein-like [Gigantopelta aegis]